MLSGDGGSKKQRQPHRQKRSTRWFLRELNFWPRAFGSRGTSRENERLPFSFGAALMKHHRCRYCRQAFEPNRYHPQQQVCNQPACQSQRRSDYHRRKIACDPVYRQVCLESPQKWRKAHQDYWKKYRRGHPEQVDRNRRQQRLRDQKRRLANLANNTLAPSQMPGVESLISQISCKQHPFGVAPASGL